jgi:hypothetical protein
VCCSNSTNWKFPILITPEAIIKYYFIVQFHTVLNYSSPLSTAEVKNAWSYNSSRSYVFMSWCKLSLYDWNAFFTSCFVHSSSLVSLVRCICFIVLWAYIIPGPYTEYSFCLVSCIVW